jgi:hypothetical protein
LTRILLPVSRHLAWLSMSYTPNATAFGVFRILFAFSLLIKPIHYNWVANVPDEFYNPGPGLQLIYGGVPSEWYVEGLQSLHFLTAAWLLIGWRTTAASIAVVAVHILGNAAVYSFSKVDHSILYDLLPLFMAAAGWGAKVSIDSRNRPRATSGYPLVLWSIIIAFAFATAAASKFISGWWSMAHFGAWSYVAEGYLWSEQKGVLAGFALDHSNPLLWKLVDWATLFAEGWLFIAILSPALFRIGLLILPVFHLSVFLTLNINFGPYLFVYAPFFLTAPSLWWARSAFWPDYGALINSKTSIQKGGP